MLVKLAQVGEGIGIAGIEPHRLFKLGPDTLGKRIRSQEGGPVSFLAQGAALPEVIGGVLPVELNRLLALAYGGVPLLKHKAHAALHVGGLGRAGVGLRKGPEQSERLVRLTGLQGRIGLGKRGRQFSMGRVGLSGRRGHQRCRQQGRGQSPCRQPQQHDRVAGVGVRRLAVIGIHFLTVMGMPSCKGSPLVVPVATQSPSLSPERMGAWVRFGVPMVTGVRTNWSSTTL